MIKQKIAVSIHHNEASKKKYTASSKLSPKNDDCDYLYYYSNFLRFEAGENILKQHRETD